MSNIKVHVQHIIDIPPTGENITVGYEPDNPDHTTIYMSSSTGGEVVFPVASVADVIEVLKNYLPKAA